MTQPFHLRPDPFRELNAQATGLQELRAYHQPRYCQRDLDRAGAELAWNFHLTQLAHDRWLANRYGWRSLGKRQPPNIRKS